jgi:chromosomal replication initiation ATPase DnaA
MKGRCFIAELPDATSPKRMAEQLILELPVRTALGRDDYFISAANADAVERLDTPDSWPNAKLVLVGPKGAGKTHLAHVWAGAEGGRVIGASELGALKLGSVETPLAVDDADNTAEDAEEALFHLHNHMAHAGLALLLTARTPPARWALQLPDLASRMLASDIARINAPDDALLAAMLVKLFADRQIGVSPALVGWIVTHCERSFAAVQRLVPALDAAALSEKRAITQPLAATVLDKLGEDAR